MSDSANGDVSYVQVFALSLFTSCPLLHLKSHYAVTFDFCTGYWKASVCRIAQKSVGL